MNSQQNFRQWLILFLISSISLFLELAVIRWLAAEIRLIAYYKNLILLACFLGLALGFAMVGKAKDNRWRFEGIWAVFVVLTVVIGKATAERLLVYPGGGDQMLWFTDDLSFWIGLVGFISIVLLFFLVSMFLFVPIGRMVGEEMAKFLPVKAYIVNILASIVGVWAFSLISFLQTPPVVWFGIGLAGLAIYTHLQEKLTFRIVGVYVVSLAAIFVFSQNTIWSPYNRLNLYPLSYTRSADQAKIQMGYLLNVQHSFYQSALDFHPASIALFEKENSIGGLEARRSAEAYEMPFQLVPAGSRVMVVGAGMGNDLAAALRKEMAVVDAVEIDPAIIALGKAYHPEKPYDDERVRVFEADARAFFAQTKERYDLIVFGLLDSHTLLSGLTSVRLDSYVYTLDSFEQVKSLLKEDGVVSITFATNDWIEERLGRMMKTVFSETPIYIYRSIIGVSFVAGEIDPGIQEQLGLAVWEGDPAYDYLPLTSDDWPYIYLRTRTIPSGYWQTLLVIAFFCMVLIYRNFPGALRPDWQFWLLGAAFLLVEFKAITELALLFGTTWFVNSLAITGVLMMALCANLLVLNRTRVDLRVSYALLFMSIAMGYLIPLEVFAGLSGGIRAVASTLLLTSPLFFAGVIFSESLRRAGETSRPLASNFSGSAVGGLLEYSSNLWGIKSIYLIAAGLYLFSYFATKWKGKG